MPPRRRKPPPQPPIKLLKSPPRTPPRISTPQPNTQSPDPTSALSPISPWPPPLPPTPSSGENLADERNTLLPSAKEIYGFLAVLLTYFSFLVYLVWAFCPARWLDAMGWTWYPDREWAIVVPCYLMVLVLLTYLAYAGLTLYNTPSPDSRSLITDPCSNIPEFQLPSTPNTPFEEPYYWKFTDPKAIPIACDLPLDLVNRVLYPKSDQSGMMH